VPHEHGRQPADDIKRVSEKPDTSHTARRFYSDSLPISANHLRGEPVDPYEADPPVRTPAPNIQKGELPELGSEQRGLRLQKDGPKGDAARTKLGGIAVHESPTNADGDRTILDEKPSDDASSANARSNESDDLRVGEPPAEWFTDPSVFDDTDTDQRAADQPPQGPPDVPSPPDGPGHPEDNDPERRPATDTQVTNMLVKINELFDKASGAREVSERREVDKVLGDPTRTHIRVTIDAYRLKETHQSKPNTTVEAQSDATADPETPANEQQELRTSTLKVTYHDADTGHAIEVYEGKTVVIPPADYMDRAYVEPAATPQEQKDEIIAKVLASTPRSNGMAMLRAMIWTQWVDTTAGAPFPENRSGGEEAVGSILNGAPKFGVAVDRLQTTERKITAGDNTILLTKWEADGKYATAQQPMFEAAAMLPTEETPTLRIYDDNVKVLVNSVGDVADKLLGIERDYPADGTATSANEWMIGAASPQTRALGLHAPTAGLTRRMDLIMQAALEEHRIPVPADIPEPTGEITENE
jgi:hypothetical protein